MKPTLAGKSWLLFSLSIVLLIGLTLFESTLARTSLAMERLITFVLFVLPTGAGAVLGIMSLVRREGKAWMAITGIIFNSVFALFHSLIVLLAG